MGVFFASAVHSAALLVLAVGLLRAMQRKRVYAALFAGLALYQLLAIPSLPAFVETFGIAVIERGSVTVLFGASLLVVAVEVTESLLGRSRPVALGFYFERVIEAPGAYLLIALGSYLVIVLATLSKGPALFNLNWEELRADRGLADSVATLLQFVAFPSAWVVYRLGWRAFGLGLLFIAVALFAVLGSRAALLTVPAVIALDFYSRGIRLRPATLFMAAVGTIGAVLVLHVGGRLLRGVGLGGLLALLQGDVSPLLDSLAELDGIDWTGGEQGINEYYFFVMSQASIPGVEPLATAFRWATMYLPRSIAPEIKPIDPTYLLWLHGVNTGLLAGGDLGQRLLELVAGGQLGSLHASFWGEAWMNGGAAAVALMALLLGATVVTVDRLFIRMEPTIVALIAPAAAVGYLMVARGNSVIGLGYIAYLLPPIVLGYWALAPFYRSGPVNAVASRRSESTGEKR